MIRTAVCGACGRMGSVIVELLLTRPDIELIGGVEAPGHPNLGRSLGSGEVVSSLAGLLERADVVVDFSVPLAALTHLDLAARQHKPYVMGVTGFSAAQLDRIRAFGSELPLVMAPNFSVGVAVLTRLVREAVVLLGPAYDVEILELHHRRKRDAPSGTAYELARIALQAGDRKRIVSGREGLVGEKPVDEIGIHAIRSGDVVGEHRVILGTDGERLELVHKASSRLAFAHGVLRAIQFASGSPAGIYDLDAVLGRP